MHYNKKIKELERSVTVGNGFLFSVMVITKLKRDDKY